MEPAKGALLSLSEIADQLGMTVEQLRTLARTGKLPARKHAGRWLVQLADVPRIIQFRRRGPRRVRGRLAEATALDDMTHQLIHRGTVVSRPHHRGQRSPAADVAAAAVQRQLDPTKSGSPTLPVPDGLAGKARQAQRAALDHLQERLNQPHAPERSM